MNEVLSTSLLLATAEFPCAYDGQPPLCPDEWPGMPAQWCGACFARAVLTDPVLGELRQLHADLTREGAGRIDLMRWDHDGCGETDEAFGERVVGALASLGFKNRRRESA